MSTDTTFLRLLAGILTLSMATATTVVAQDFPITIDHKFGSSVIEEKPVRVASIDFGGIGNLLAVGVYPVTVQQWRPMDGFPFTAGPWAAPLLTTEPVVLDGDLDFEAIAATRPDVIIALYSGIDSDEYQKLSLIAPVVAVPEGVGDYALSWQQRALIAGRAVGEEAEAERQINAIRETLSDIASTHPQWQGMTAVLGGFRDGRPLAYTAYDVRTQFLYEMGFKPTPAMTALTEEGDFVLDNVSTEQLNVIDADVIVHYVTDAGVEEALAEPGRQFLQASQTGGEVFLGDRPVAALARLTLLSIPVALEALVPMLEAAADGDPDTPVPDARR